VPAPDGFKIIGLGDLLYSSPLADVGAAGLSDLIALWSSADLTVANLEVPLYDPNSEHAYPNGPYLVAAPFSLAGDIRRLGVDVVTLANNHSTDFGPSGLREMLDVLDRASLTHAGAGSSLREARSASIKIVNGVRVATVSVASTFKHNSGALDPSYGLGARAGISTLRHRPSTGHDSDVTYFEPNLFDEHEVLQAVSTARAEADVVVFALHGHENDGGYGQDDETAYAADFLVKLFRRAVDAGADIVFGGGPHSLRGVEIYRSKPIFHGLGVVFLNAEILLTPDDHTDVYGVTPGEEVARAQAQAVPGGSNPRSWYDGFTAELVVEDGGFTSVLLHPFEIEDDREDPEYGIPRPASAAAAQRILSSVQSVSERYSTKIEIMGTRGEIRLN
jgi:poly-gamma-glutamate synthesis protein (capsule biosynthesis protein)